MDKDWDSQFRERMTSFEAAQPNRGISASLKVRVTSGCFHREHSPSAYAIIDKQLASIPHDRQEQFDLVEHESGPELLVSLVLATAGLGLAKSVIDLIVTILQARRDGIREGDRPSEPVELIVRRIDDRGNLREETILRLGPRDAVDRAETERLLHATFEGHVGDTPDKGQ